MIPPRSAPPTTVQSPKSPGETTGQNTKKGQKTLKPYFPQLTVSHPQTGMSSHFQTFKHSAILSPPQSGVFFCAVLAAKGLMVSRCPLFEPKAQAILSHKRLGPWNNQDLISCSPFWTESWFQRTWNDPKKGRSCATTKYQKKKTLHTLHTQMSTLGRFRANDVPETSKASLGTMHCVESLDESPAFVGTRKDMSSHWIQKIPHLGFVLLRSGKRFLRCFYFILRLPLFQTLVPVEQNEYKYQ